MAFHYQNLLQEEDLKYEGFEEKYGFILEYTNDRLEQYYKRHRKATMKNLQELAFTSVYSHDTILEKRQEKILVANNILFSNIPSFLRHIFSDEKTTIESCYQLKEKLNSLDPKDKDFLNGTMEGLVRYHLPCFNRVKIEYGIWEYDEFIIWRLMELLYLSPEAVKENYEKVKRI